MKTEDLINNNEEKYNNEIELSKIDKLENKRIEYEFKAKIYEENVKLIICAIYMVTLVLFAAITISKI